VIECTGERRGRREARTFSCVMLVMASAAKRATDSPMAPAGGSGEPGVGAAARLTSIFTNKGSAAESPILRWFSGLTAMCPNANAVSFSTSSLQPVPRAAPVQTTHETRVCFVFSSFARV
jgi:hypothetical protein